MSSTATRSARSTPSSRRTTSAAPCPISSTPTSPTRSASASPASPAPRVLVGSDMRPSGPSWSMRSPRRAWSRASTSSTSAWPRPTCVYYAAGTLDAPGAMFTASHNPAQYNGVKFCLSGARPVGADTGLAEIKAIAADVLDGQGPQPRRGAGSITSAQPARRVRRPRRVVRRHRRRCARCASSPTPPTAWAAWSCRRCSSGCRRSPSRSCTASSTARSPTTRPTRCSRRTSATCRRGSSAGGFDIGLAFDGDADRVFVVDEPGRGLSGSTTTAMLATALLRNTPRRHHPAQPDLLAGRARGHPRARRRAGAHQGRPLVHQAGHGRDRRGVRRRALGALLLPRQLPRRQRAHRIDVRARRAQPGRHRPVGGAQAVRALLGERRDQHPGRRSRRGHRAGRGGVRRATTRIASTASPSTAARGGSTCARPTPSRCFDSTSRRPTRDECDQRVVEVLALDHRASYRS